MGLRESRTVTSHCSQMLHSVWDLDSTVEAAGFYKQSEKASLRTAEGVSIRHAIMNTYPECCK